MRKIEAALTLFASYVEFGKTRGERRLMTREGLGRFFVGLGAQPNRWRNGTVGEHLKDVDNLHGGTSRKAALVKQERATGYALGNLDDARASFTDVTGLTVEWDSGAPAEAAEDG